MTEENYKLNLTDIIDEDAFSEFSIDRKNKIVRFRVDSVLTFEDLYSPNQRNIRDLFISDDIRLAAFTDEKGSPYLSVVIHNIERGIS